MAGLCPIHNDDNDNDDNDNNSNSSKDNNNDNDNDSDSKNNNDKYCVCPLSYPQKAGFRVSPSGAPRGAPNVSSSLV